MTRRPSGPATLRAALALATAAALAACGPAAATQSASSPSGADVAATSPASSAAAPAPAATSAPATSAVPLDVAQPLSGTVVVPAGRTESLAGVARVAGGAVLDVRGTLVLQPGAVLSGTGWTGVRVEQGGRLTASGARISGASTALAVQPGGAATLQRTSIDHEQVPFHVSAGATLTLDSVTVGRAGADSTVDGTLVATGLVYDKGAADGISATQGTAQITITHSRLFGDGPNSGDMLSMRGAHSLSVSWTEITGAHCAFHVVGLDELALDHGNLHGNSYGFMMYATSDVGTRTITATDIVDNRDFGIDEGSPTNRNGPITVTGSYIAGNGVDLRLLTGAITVSDPAHAPVV